MANSRNKPPPEGFVHRLSEVLAGMDVSGGRLCVGLSGGVDSVALLLGLHSLKSTLGFELSALHVNHGLSPHANAWQSHCAALCDALQVPLSIHRASVARDDPRGVEAAARQARRDAFSKSQADCLVLAHHSGDQAETLLFRLLRGAGVRGCAAMKPQAVWIVRQGRSLRVLRPLLGFSKADLLQFVVQSGQSWVTDESNADSHFSRNFLRAEILPRLNRKFPGADKVLVRAAGLFAEADELLADLARGDLDRVRVGEGLRIDSLRALGEPRVRNLLRHVMDRFGMLAPDMERLSELVRQCLSAREDRSLLVRVDGRYLARFDGALYFLREAPFEPQADIVWEGEACLAWGGGHLALTRSIGEGLAWSKIEHGGLRVARRGGGEKIAVAINRPSRTLKQLYQAHRIPPWLRGNMPLMWCGQSLVGVGNLALHTDYVCSPGEPGLKICWHPPDMVLSLSQLALS